MKPVHFLLLAVLLIFYGAVLTQSIQEDAFIYFRTASNISLYGDYSFNIGERYPAATSALYAYMIAGHIALLGNFFALTLQSFNVLIAILGAYLLSISTYRGHENKYIFNPFVFWMVVISPPLVTLSTSGMETSLVFLALATLIYGFNARNGACLALASLFLPLLRVEAVIASALVSFLALLRGDRDLVFFSIGGAVAGILIFFLLNFSLAGEILPQTITAKSAAYDPPKDISSIMARLGVVFFERSFFLGISTKFIPAYIYAFIGICGLVACAVVATRYGISLLYSGRDTLLENTGLVLVVGLILVFPLGYVYGGVIFSWYLLPSSVFTYYLLAQMTERAAAGRVRVLVGASAFVTGLSLFNLLLLTNSGYQETQFRADVGRFIAEESDQGDTLFLEPAGYIPYYAGLRTWDTVGLVSPDVLNYRSRDNPSWWLDFVKDKAPTYIVERSPLHLDGLPDSTRPEGFTSEDRAEWSQVYELVQHFVYAEYLHANRSIMTPIYQLGSHSDYYVYRRVGAP